MQPDEKKLLSEVYDLVKENNEILCKMRRISRWGIAFKVFYWTVIIILSVGAYWIIQPLIDELGNVSGGIKAQIDTIRGISDKVGL